MSLSCLTCQGLQRSDSDPGLDQDNKPFERLSPVGVSRKRSGCLGCSPRERIRKGSSSFSAATPPTPPTPKGSTPRKAPRKFATTSNMEEHAAAAAAAVPGEQPRLVRSSGMRRDWSFEDLQKKVLVVNMHRPVQ